MFKFFALLLLVASCQTKNPVFFSAQQLYDLYNDGIIKDCSTDLISILDKEKTQGRLTDVKSLKS